MRARAGRISSSSRRESPLGIGARGSAATVPESYFHFTKPSPSYDTTTAPLFSRWPAQDPVINGIASVGGMFVHIIGRAYVVVDMSSVLERQLLTDVSLHTQLVRTVECDAKCSKMCSATVSNER